MSGRIRSNIRRPLWPGCLSGPHTHTLPLQHTPNMLSALQRTARAPTVAAVVRRLLASAPVSRPLPRLISSPAATASSPCRTLCTSCGTARPTVSGAVSAAVAVGASRSTNSSRSLLRSSQHARGLHTSARRLLQLGGGPPAGGAPPEQGAQGTWVNPANVPPSDVLQKYCHDLTALAKEGKLDPVIGRDAEMRRTIEILSRRTKNNPVLLGEVSSGTGSHSRKEAVASGSVCAVFGFPSADADGCAVCALFAS
jgi:hypothetical protein